MLAGISDDTRGCASGGGQGLLQGWRGQQGLPGHRHHSTPACQERCSPHYSTGAPEQLSPCRKLICTSLSLLCRHFWHVTFERVLAEGRFSYVVHRIIPVISFLVFELWRKQFSWSLCFIQFFPLVPWMKTSLSKTAVSKLSLNFRYHASGEYYCLMLCCLFMW